MKLLKALISVILTIVVIAGGFILFVNAKYGINMFDVIKSLDKLSATVDVETLATNAIQESDYATTKTELNAQLGDLILFDSETATYSINTSLSSSLTEDMKLTGKNACVLLNLMLDSNEEGIKANNGGQEVDLKEYDKTQIDRPFDYISKCKEFGFNKEYINSLLLDKSLFDFFFAVVNE